MVRRAVERCSECTHGRQCPGHLAMSTQADAAMASAIGAAWARFVRGQVDVRRPWPAFTGRSQEIAFRLVGGLGAKEARAELARICHWRAGLVWESLERPRLRDRPYEEPAAGAAVYQLPGSALSVHFRTRRRSIPKVPAAGSRHARGPRRDG